MQISHKQGGTPREGREGGGLLWLFDCLELYARTLLQCDSFLCVCLDCMSNCLGEVFYLNSHSAKVFNNFDYWPFASGSSRNGQNSQKKKRPRKRGSWEKFSQPGSAEMNASVAINYQICIMFTFLQRIVP